MLHGGVVFALSASLAFAASRPRRIGYLELVAAPDGEALFREFIEAMRDAGLVEGRNLIVVRRSAAGRNEALRSLARELVDADVEVIVAASTESARAAKHAAPRTAVVFTISGDPVFEGLVASLDRVATLPALRRPART